MLISIFSDLNAVLTIAAAGLAMIGLTRLVLKWNSGEQMIDKEILAWFGGMIFFSIASLAVQIAFGV